jgi:hypothetical protein
VAPALRPSTQAPATTVAVTDPVEAIAKGSEAQPPTTTSTTTTTAHAGTKPEPSTDEVDQLLAELDTQLAGLDQLLNDATAAMAAEEGEIVP